MIRSRVSKSSISPRSGNPWIIQPILSDGNSQRVTSKWISALSSYVLKTISSSILCFISVLYSSFYRCSTISKISKILLSQPLWEAKCDWCMWPQRCFLHPQSSISLAMSSRSFTHSSQSVGSFSHHPIIPDFWKSPIQGGQLCVINTSTFSTSSGFNTNASSSHHDTLGTRMRRSMLTAPPTNKNFSPLNVW